jgi:hypothetical protein
VNLQGLGILIRRGMAAWMHACAAITPSGARSTSTVGDFARVLPNLQHDVAEVLAAMALTITTEVET